MNYYSPYLDETVYGIEDDSDLYNYIFENLTSDDIIEAIVDYCSIDEVIQRMLDFYSILELYEVFPEEIQCYIDNLFKSFKKIEEDEEDEEDEEF